MTYTVYEWHLGGTAYGLVAEDLTVEEVMELEFRYVKFDKENGKAWVTRGSTHFALESSRIERKKQVALKASQLSQQSSHSTMMRSSPIKSSSWLVNLR